MADTLDNILLPAGTWVDLYDESGITVGTQINVQNVGAGHIYLYAGATSPISLSGYAVLVEYGVMQNDSGDSGAWAYSESGGKVNVRASV